MKKKVILITAAVIVAATLAGALLGCNRFNTATPDLADIYRDYAATDAEIDGAELCLTLPKGWGVLSSYTSHPDSDIGYIRSLNAFIVVKNGCLSVAKVPEDGSAEVKESDLLIPESAGVKAIHAVGDVLVVRIDSNDAFVGVLDANGRWLLNANKTSSLGETATDETLSGALRVLDGELVAVAAKYVVDPAFTGGKSSTAIYRLSTGELVGWVASDGGVSGVLGFDGRYVSVETTSSSSGRETVIYDVPGTLQQGGAMQPASNAVFRNTSGHEDYYTEATYLGNGRFFVHTEWTVSSTDSYDYAYNGEYYKMLRYTYNAATGERAQYSSAHVFLNCVNTYYDLASGRSVDESTVVVPSSYLREGYTYASFGLIIGADKQAMYDQFILDENLNIVYSLTTNFGIRPEGSLDREEVSIYDLMMQGSDGYFYARLYPSAIRLYSADGKLVFQNDEHDYVSVSVQNGMVIAEIENEDGKHVFGAFDLAGNNVIPFEYSSILPFRSFYTYAVTTDNKRVLLGRDGSIAPAEGEEGSSTAHFPDIATTSGSKPVVQRGCYIYKVSTEGGTRFGVKNMSGDYDDNVVFDAILMADSYGPTLYSPNSDNSLVFVWGTRADDGVFCVYRLTASGSAAPADATLPDWGIGLIAAGCTVVVLGAVIATVAVIRKKRAAIGADKADEEK